MSISKLAYVHPDAKLGKDVTVEPFATIQGDVVGWLTSDIFGLKEARSLEGETVMLAAEAYMAGDTANQPENMRTKNAIQQQMTRVLPGDDPIWSRWLLKTQGGVSR